MKIYSIYETRPPNDYFILKNWELWRKYNPFYLALLHNEEPLKRQIKILLSAYKNK